MEMYSRYIIWKTLSPPPGKNKCSKISVLLAIRWSDQYKRVITDICQYMDSLEIEMDIYFLDYMSICNDGSTMIDGKKYCLEEEAWLLSNPPHLCKAYSVSGRKVSSPYLKELYKEPVEFHLDLPDEQLKLDEYKSAYVNHINGRRLTCGYSGNGSLGRVYILGDSRVSGMLTEDADTICSFLQRDFNKQGADYEVVNMGISGRSIERMCYQAEHIHLTPKDILIILSGCYEYEQEKTMINFEVWFQNLLTVNSRCKQYGAKFMYFHIPPIYELHNRKKTETEVLDLITGTKFAEYKNVDVRQAKEYLRMKCMIHGIMYFDLKEDIEIADKDVYINVHHFGPNGNDIIAKSVFEKIQVISMLDDQKLVQKGTENRRTRMIEFEQKYVKNKSVEEWIKTVKEKFDVSDGGKAKTGAIIMNANPFTRGHLALVEYALQRVERLFVFVLEEDASYFSFKDRMSMVQRNLKKYENVLVIPSGKFIISRNTFPEYFKKEKLQDEKIDMSKDVSIFGKYIAPAFHITCRFVGTEPEDMVTKQYNEQLKKLLPEYGITYECMPRVSVSGKYVSASAVRHLYEKKEFNKLETLVTQETLEYLKNQDMKINSQNDRGH